MSAAVDLEEREVAWPDLGSLLEERDLAPSYADRVGRAYVVVDDVLVWAHVGGVRLDPALPGAGRLQLVRLDAAIARGREGTDLGLVLVDPPQWEIDAYCERHGIEEFR